MVPSKEPGKTTADSVGIWAVNPLGGRGRAMPKVILTPFLRKVGGEENEWALLVDGIVVKPQEFADPLRVSK